MNKKGDYKWGIIISLILGLMVLSFSLYFIFNEVWTGEDSDRQICRQSIQLRSTLPDVTIKKMIDIGSFKDEFPLKCKTHVVEIGRDDVVLNKNGEMKAGKKIVEAMAECWALYDKGDASAFPLKFYKDSTCVPCARIHLTNDAKKELGKKNIDIRGALDLQMGKGYSYYDYLSKSGKKFSAFSFGNGVSFDLEADNFGVNIVESKPWERVELKNKINGASYSANILSADISLPKFFDSKKGDLLINYGIVGIGDDSFSEYVPYLFYFQTGQEPNPFKEPRNFFIFNIPEALWNQFKQAKWGIIYSIIKQYFSKEDVDVGVRFCDMWEGIPA